MEKSQPMTVSKELEKDTLRKKMTFKEAHQELLKLSPKERTEIALKEAEKRGYLCSYCNLTK